MPGDVATNTIGGVTYRMTPLGARTAGHVALRAGKRLLDVLKARDRAAFMGALVDGLRGLSEEDFDFIVDKLTEATVFDHEDPKRPGTLTPMRLGPVWDEHFRGRLEDEIALAAWGMEVNFGRFLAAGLALFGPAAASGSSSPGTSPASGSSGDSSSASE